MARSRERPGVPRKEPGKQRVFRIELRFSPERVEAIGKLYEGTLKLRVIRS